MIICQGTMDENYPKHGCVSYHNSPFSYKYFYLKRYIIWKKAHDILFHILYDTMDYSSH